MIEDCIYSDNEEILLLGIVCVFYITKAKLLPVKPFYTQRRTRKLSSHLIRLSGIERVPRRHELVRDDIAQIHQVIEALFQGFEGGRVLWYCQSASCPVA